MSKSTKIDSESTYNNIKLNRQMNGVADINLSPNQIHFDSNKAPAQILPLSNTTYNKNNNLSNSSKSIDDCFNMTQFSRSCVGSSKYLMNAHLNVVSDDDLVFESRFESGNLAKAIKITPVYYELYLRPDLYTNKHTQWFYFRVTNVKKGFTYRYFSLLIFIRSINKTYFEYRYFFRHMSHCMFMNSILTTISFHFISLALFFIFFFYVVFYSFIYGSITRNFFIFLDYRS